MYLNVFHIIFVILLYQCLVIFPFVMSMEKHPDESIKSDSNNCSIPLPDKNDFETPIPTTLNSEGNSLYTTEHVRQLEIKAEEFFKLSCLADRHISMANKELDMRELMIKCVDKDVVKYADELHKIDEFKCKKTLIRKPRAIPDNTKPSEHQTQSNLEPWQRYSRGDFLSKKGPDDCYIYIPAKEYLYPIPFTMAYRPSIIIPDCHGNVYIKHNTTFKITCANGKFADRKLRHQNEVIVQCIRGDQLLFNWKTYKFSDFKCLTVPTARFIMTGYKCQQNFNVGTVGLQTKFKLLMVYSVCFDKDTKNNLYSWYRINTPFRDNRQNIPLLRPTFVKTRQMFGEIDLNEVYKNQNDTVAELLGSKSVADKYINFTSFGNFLSRGHLVAKTEFFYSFEQQATFFYENTAPTWQIFNQEIWKQVEKYFRYRLAKAKIGKHVIITGTYKVCELPDYRNKSVGIHLIPPNSMKVPLFIWKMDYNINLDKGIVVIGLNNPFMKYDRSVYICDTMICPIRLRMRLTGKKGIVYCCSREQFEKAYGPLDPITFKKNMV